MPPRISVIIPTYNQSGTLRRAVSSVLGQTFDNFEIVVVNDASTDETKAVLSRFGDPRIRTVSHGKNRGAAASRNTGIRESTGDFIAFLDSDDEWLQDKLSQQIAMIGAAPPDMQACCTRYFVTLNPYDKSWRRMLPLEHDWFTHLLRRGCDLSPGSTLMARRSIFEELGLFDETLQRYEDWDWLLRYARRFKIGITQETLAVVHLSHPPVSGILADAIKVFLPRWIEEARKLGYFTGRRFKARLLLELAKSQILEHKRIVGCVTLLRGLCQWPFQRPGSALALIQYLKGNFESPHAVRVESTNEVPPRNN